MKLLCPKCRKPIPVEDVNISSDLAKCTECDEVFRASELVGDIELKEKLDLPTGSRISYEPEAGEDGMLVIPPTGFKSTDVFPFIFMTFWLGFVAFWTWGASHGSIFFALFSIPFWCAGLGMLWGLIKGITERQDIEIGFDALTLRKTSLLTRKEEPIFYDEIGKIEYDQYVAKGMFDQIGQFRNGFNQQNNQNGLRPKFVIITYGAKQLTIAESCTAPEKEWLHGFLKSLVFKKTGKQV